VTQISILRGIYADGYSNLRESYPVNLEPVVLANGVSNGNLHSAPGITGLNTGPGEDRGGIIFQQAHYRVMGSSLCEVTGSAIAVRGTMTGTTGPTPMDYSFDYLGIISSRNLYLYSPAHGLQQVTDTDLGPVIDIVWIDGYFVLTDGTYLIVTDLADPFSVNPLKYGSSEAAPDPVTGVMKVRGELYAVNRYTIENFQNVGGIGFPFQRNENGLIPKGCVGTSAKAYFLDTFGFVGSGLNEAVGVFLAGNGTAEDIGTLEIYRELAALTDAQLAAIECDAKVELAEQRFYVHLPDKTLVYSRQASQAAGSPVWHKLAAGAFADSAYPARHFVLNDGLWYCGWTDGNLGKLDQSVSTYFGQTAGWGFDTSFVYNEGRGGILKSLELVALPGSAPLGLNPAAFLSLTQDGKTWGQERSIGAGAFGENRKRLQWRPKVRFQNYVGCRFRGSDTAIASFMRLEADIEPLNV
jgi:hypothetical protein